jgi:hypothetical protein
MNELLEIAANLIRGVNLSLQTPEWRSSAIRFLERYDFYKTELGTVYKPSKYNNLKFELKESDYMKNINQYIGKYLIENKEKIKSIDLSAPIEFEENYGVPKEQSVLKCDYTPEENISVICLGCKDEATSTKTILSIAGWSDFEVNPEKTDGSYSAICMRPECKKKFGVA